MTNLIGAQPYPTPDGELAAYQLAVERLKAGLRTIDDCLSTDCDCLDPPESSDPSDHAQYCAVYLRAYIAALIDGKPTPA